MLKIGDNIPNINVTTHKGETINLTNFKGKKVILFFYPRATSQGYEVIGVSPDTVDKQNKFADKFGFKYNLLADDSRELIDAFGVWGKKKFRGNEYEGVLRTTFIIDEEGVIERVIDKVNTKDHADQILD